ncbi:wd40 repeat-like protein [Diplodia corticola]|uniref:Wd40 repeat-like protein n=1 Tax=Diplodia corticola TaxID=236234 RepID=A0A1J9RFH6_9PEZI|nr:wd40 repeat-like protein [Diplodia corticola]OJD38842.1 wd40 repeat-like protein [Diplodia corticola]
MPSAADLPNLRATLRIDGKVSTGNDRAQFTARLYDVQFYPYTPPGVDPIFAATGGQQTFVCRPTLDRDNAVEIIREFRDEDQDLELNSLVWSQDIDGNPLLCVAGSPSSIIRVLNVTTGKLTRSLAGHGAAINDLAVSPLSPHILASASEDHSVRIWNLHPNSSKQPCPVICSGAEGHRDRVLSVSFHSSGRYLISGAMDSSVKIWVLPELSDTEPGTDKVNIIHYPHFSTTEVHSDVVDCVLFYGDLVLSRSAKENQILLWKIDGFNSNSPPPPLSTAGQNEAHGINNPDESSDAYGSTASAFGRRFQRLLSFDTPMTPLFYNRFGLFHMPHKHPILVMGNEKSRFMWWDLQRLEEGSDDIVKTEMTFRVPNKRKRTERDGSGVGAGRSNLISREESIASNASSGIASTGTGSSSVQSGNSNSADKKAAVKKLWSISDPFAPVPPHKSIVIPKMTFCSRQIAWSVGGEWAVAVGDHGMVCVFRRWE